VRAAGAEDAFTGCVPQVEPEGDTAPLSFKRLAICGLLALAAFLAFDENRFTLSNVALWGVTLGFCLHALRVPTGATGSGVLVGSAESGRSDGRSIFRHGCCWFSLLWW
jgi:hypothetical protein